MEVQAPTPGFIEKDSVSKPEYGVHSIKQTLTPSTVLGYLHCLKVGRLKNRPQALGQWEKKMLHVLPTTAEQCCLQCQSANQVLIQG